MIDDGRWLVLGIAGALAAGAAASRVLQGSAVRVGPRLQPRSHPPLPLSKTDPLPTGLANLDEALGRSDKAEDKTRPWPGVAGWPRGRIVELYGPDRGMLDALALQSVAACQRRGATVAFIDAGHALDTSYAAGLGVDLERLLVAQPDTLEQALDVIKTLVKSRATELIVADAVNLAKGPEDEMNARAWSTAMRTMTATAEHTNTTVLFVNPTQKKPGTFGDTETTDTGNALKYYASVRVEGRRLGAGFVRFKVVKNKLAAPFRSVDAELVFGKGLVPVSRRPDDDDASGSAVRVGPRLRVPPGPVIERWSKLHHAPPLWPDKGESIRVLAGALHVLGNTDTSLPLIEGKVTQISVGSEPEPEVLWLSVDDINLVPAATRAFNLREGFEEDVVEIYAPFSWRSKVAVAGSAVRVAGSAVRVGPRLRAAAELSWPKRDLGRIRFTTGQGDHRLMGLVVEPDRAPFWIWQKVDIDPSRHVYIVGWYTALEIRRVGTTADHAEAVRVFTNAIPGIVRDVYGDELWEQLDLRGDLVRPISKISSRGAYGPKRMPLITQDYGVRLGDIDAGPGPRITRAWPPIAPEVHHPEEWAKFREVDRRLQARGFRTG